MGVTADTREAPNKRVMFKVRTPFVAMESGRPAFFFPAGAVIEITADEAQGNSQVTVVYDGRQVQAFRRDIEKRAERVSSPSTTTRH